MTASAAVGPASRPITLYYATVQAGLAIAAAHKTDPWSFSRHGLKLRDVRSSIADLQVGPEGTGDFQVVAQATGSPVLHGPVTFGALRASLPDLQEAPLAPASTPNTMAFLPHRSASRAEARVVVLSPNPGRDSFESHLAKLLPLYPGAEQAGSVTGSYQEIRQNRWAADIQWSSPVDFDQIAPAYRYVDERYLRPSVDGQGGQSPSPFMTW
ncbi:hypothetical protein CSH63_05080 [Micromonospora tulbaghiae]|uniref:Uncharacterized protein n=1 Tax=Micromonospora tulbaghiae TaxID=479978 RepID=A0A386WH67_9ACTN|nr:hypothetical protein [Micromonospora tulbaghiae]AYF26839.1 hypothetical protein CSH63_05080 [Micromonospora tulbaghiae]